MIELKIKCDLLKEALTRANKKEKQEYENILKKQIVLGERFDTVMKEWQDIRDKQKHKYGPQEPQKSQKSTEEMSTDEFMQEMKANNKYFHDCLHWNTEQITTNTEQIGKVSQLVELITEFIALENEAKWLLLSIALRTQPNLLKYIRQ
jgi:hypothetical protein